MHTVNTRKSTIIYTSSLKPNSRYCKLMFFFFLNAYVQYLLRIVYVYISLLFAIINK